MEATNGAPLDAGELKRSEAVIWSYGDVDDETDAVVNKAVAAIERALRPYPAS